MKKYIPLLFTLIPIMFLFACAGQEEAVEVTRVIEVEVTRIVEVEVTRIITPTASPSSAFGSPECKQYTEAIEGLVDQWVDSYEVASSTARVNLSDRVADMQEIKRDVSALSEPECATHLAVQARLATMIDDGTSIFLDFMEDNDTSAEMLAYSISLDLATDAVNALRNEAGEKPRRIHYIAFGDTSFAVDYLGNDGLVQKANSGARFNPDNHPVVLTTLMPESERALIRLYNPLDGGEEVNCFILVNGEETVSNTANGRVECEL